MSARRSPVVVAGSILAAVALLSSAAILHSAPQQVPGNLQPGTITPGSTAVQVVNQPTVQAQQVGEWRVSVPGGVTINKGGGFTFEGPDFLEVGKRYTIRWDAGVAGSYTIVQVSRGWALVRTSGSRLWVNTALAVAIEEER
jgi:hypothetical protein